MAIKIRIIAALLILLTAIGVMYYSGTQLIQTQQTYEIGDSNYQNLRDQVRKSEIIDNLDIADLNSIEIAEMIEKPNKPDKSEKPEKPGDEAGTYTAPKPQIHIPDLGIDFDAVKALNSNIAAWLYCPGTAIDYPVMKADNYAYYLTRLPDGTANANGSLFIDFNHAPDFGDPLTIIYGHHMKSGSMFGSLIEYKKQTYYKEYPFMYLYTEHKNYRIDLKYGCLIGKDKWKEEAFMYAENLDSLLSYAKSNTTFESTAPYEAGDRIIALSTCAYDFNDARYILVGILREQ